MASFTLAHIFSHCCLRVRNNAAGISKGKMVSEPRWLVSWNQSGLNREILCGDCRWRRQQEFNPRLPVCFSPGHICTYITGEGHLSAADMFTTALADLVWLWTYKLCKHHTSNQCWASVVDAGPALVWCVVFAETGQFIVGVHPSPPPKKVFGLWSGP